MTAGDDEVGLEVVENIGVCGGHEATEAMLAQQGMPVAGHHFG